jgi:hypothetical protein
MGAGNRSHIQSDAVNAVSCNALTSAYIPHQATYLNVCAVRDEEASASDRAARHSAVPSVRMSVRIR